MTTTPDRSRRTPKVEKDAIWEHRETGMYLGILVVDGERVNVAPVAVFDGVSPLLEDRRWITIRTLRRTHKPATYPLSLQIAG